MNAKKTIATIGLTGVLGLTTLGGITPAMAAETGGNDHKDWNSVSQAAHMKDHDENNREAAHAHSYGQQWKQWRMNHVDPKVESPIDDAPKVETPVTTTPKVDAPVTTPIEAPVTAPVTTPVNVSPKVETSPKVDAPVGNVTTGDNLDGNSVLNAPLSGDKVGEANPDLGGLNLSGAPKFF